MCMATLSCFQAPRWGDKWPDDSKTTIANTAMNILSIEACTFRGRWREYFGGQLTFYTSLELMYDDPNKVKEVENIIIDFYN